MRLQSYTPVRGCCVGAYGEASPDVHAILAEAATAMARQRWRAMGARDAAEARAFFVQRLRQRLGVVAVLRDAPFYSLDSDNS